MNLRQMRYILEIAREGNITAAAGNLYISQPSLSNLLAGVERDLGAQLFDRSVSPIILTYAGEKYVEAAKKIMGTYRELRQVIDDMQESLTGRLNIGCSPQLSPLLIPAILPIMMERYPGIDLRLTEESSVVLEELLLDGTLDVLLCGGTGAQPGFTNITLLEEELILLAPPGKAVPILPKIGDDRLFDCVDLAALEGAPFVLMKARQQMRKVQDRILEENGCKPDLVLETGSWQTCLRMVTCGMAYTILPYVASETPIHQTDQYCLPQKHYRRTLLIYRKNGYYSKVLDAFIQVSKNVLLNQSSSSR